MFVSILRADSIPIPAQCCEQLLHLRLVPVCLGCFAKGNHLPDAICECADGEVVVHDLIARLRVLLHAKNALYLRQGIPRLPRMSEQRARLLAPLRGALHWRALAVSNHSAVRKVASDTSKQADDGVAAQSCKVGGAKCEAEKECGGQRNGACAAESLRTPRLLGVWERPPVSQGDCAESLPQSQRECVVTVAQRARRCARGRCCWCGRGSP